MTTEVSAEARWRNYQHLIWTQQQIHLQIQQQHLQTSTKGIADTDVEQADNSNSGMVGMSNAQTGLNENEKLIDKKTKEMNDPWTLDNHSAFLGPTLWEKRLPYDGQDFKLEYMELEDFLTENGIPVETPTPEIFPVGGVKNGASQQQQRDLGHAEGVNLGSMPSRLQREAASISQFMVGSSRPATHHSNGVSQMLCMSSVKKQTSSSRSSSPTGSSSRSSSMSRQDMNPATSPDSNESSGHDFDPRTRAFTDDELKPQPMIKKSKKQLVPDEQKDAKYWSRRKKNNMAAKRSRDARRVKENQIAMRAGFLEKENQAFKDQLEKIRDELKRSNNEIIMLKGQLSHCHREH